MDAKKFSPLGIQISFKRTLQFSFYIKIFYFRFEIVFSSINQLRKLWHTICFGLYNHTQTGRRVFKAACIATESRQL